MKTVTRKTARIVATVVAVDANRYFWESEEHFGAESEQCCAYYDAQEAAAMLHHAAYNGNKKEVRAAYRACLKAADAAGIQIFAC